jgi:hypothetical protein
MWDFDGKDNTYLPCPTMAGGQPNHGERFKNMVTFFNWFIRDSIPNGWQPAGGLQPSSLPRIPSPENFSEEINQMAKVLSEKQAKQHPTLGDDLAGFLM